MKPYDLVIQDTLEDLIAVTNIAVSLGYQPIGGIQIIEDKFIQTIHLTNNEMGNFMKSITLLMKDRQEFKFEAKKIGEDLVLTITPDAKNGRVHDITVPADELNDEIDAKILAKLNAPVVSEKVEFQHSVREGTKGDKPARANISPSKKPAAKKSGSISKQKTAAKPSVKAASKKSSDKLPNKSSKQSPKKGLAELTGKKKKGLSDLLDESKARVAEAAKAPVAAMKEATAAMSKVSAKVAENKIAPEDELSAQTDAGTVQNSSESDTKDPLIATNIPISETKPELGETTEVDTKKMFDDFMAEGKKLFDDRKYKDAQVAYQSAVDLKPENDRAQKALAMTIKWVKAIESMPKPQTT